MGTLSTGVLSLSHCPGRAVPAGHWLTPVFSTFSSPSAGSLVQAALTQPPSVSVNLGKTAQITCYGFSSSYVLAVTSKRSPAMPPSL